MQEKLPDPQSQSILALLPKKLIQCVVLPYLDNVSLINFGLTCKKYNFFTENSNIFKERKEQNHNDQEVKEFIKKNKFQACQFLKLFINNTKVLKEKAALIYIYLMSKSENEKPLDAIFLDVINNIPYKTALKELKGNLTQLNHNINNNNVKNWSLVYSFTSYAREMKKLLIPSKLRNEKNIQLYKAPGERINECANQTWKIACPLLILCILLVLTDKFYDKNSTSYLYLALFFTFLKNFMPSIKEKCIQSNSESLEKFYQSNKELYEFILHEYQDLILKQEDLIEEEISNKHFLFV